MRTILYIVRHGQSYSNESNAKGAMTSSLEKKGSLTSLGRKQAENLATKLKRIHFDAIIASDTTRDIAIIIGKYYSCKSDWILGYRLRERDRGQHLLGMNEKDVKKYLGVIYEEYLSFPSEQQFHHRFF
jgi:broad specificity phosphatase PhoE